MLGMRLSRQLTAASLAAAVIIGLALPVSAQDGRATDRLAGDTRFATAATIAQTAFPDGADTLYLARADDPADALAASALTDGPILLTPTTGTPPAATLDAITTLDPATITALGGPAAISETMLFAAAGVLTVGRPDGVDEAAIPATLPLPMPSSYEGPGPHPDAAGVTERLLVTADVTVDELVAWWLEQSGDGTDAPILCARDAPDCEFAGYGGNPSPSSEREILVWSGSLDGPGTGWTILIDSAEGGGIAVAIWGFAG